MKWKRVRAELEKYAAENGHGNVPRDFVTQDGYGLGLKVYRIRRGTFGRHDEKRMAWLRERGFVSNIYAEAVDRRVGHLTTFREKNGHLNIAQI